MIFGARVEQAREFRGSTQQQLADKLGVTQVAIARIEGGAMQPSEANALALSRSLGFPLSFFERDVPHHFAMGTLEFRARTSATAKAKKQAHQYASLVFEFAVSLAARLNIPTLRLPSRLPSDPEEAASVLRSEIGLSPNTPIPNLTNALERAGVFVFALSDMFAGCDGFSVWGGFKRALIPAIFVSASSPGDRERLTIAHEVGELTLLDMPPGRERENRANRFAGALLMPADAIRRDLIPPVSLDDFFEIKKRYKVSIQAAIVRARHLGIITEGRYTALFRQLSASGSRIVEPAELSVSREKPRALRKMAELLYGEQLDFVRVGAEARLDPLLVAQLLNAHASKSDLAGLDRRDVPAQVLPFRRALQTR